MTLLRNIKGHNARDMMVYPAQSNLVKYHLLKHHVLLFFKVVLLMGATRLPGNGYMHYLC